MDFFLYFFTRKLDKTYFSCIRIFMNIRISHIRECTSAVAGSGWIALTHKFSQLVSCSSHADQFCLTIQDTLQPQQTALLRSSILQTLQSALRITLENGMELSGDACQLCLVSSGEAFQFSDLSVGQSLPVFFGYAPPLKPLYQKSRTCFHFLYLPDDPQPAFYQGLSDASLGTFFFPSCFSWLDLQQYLLGFFFYYTPNR